MVYRGTAPNPAGVLTTIPAGTTFADTNAVERNDLLLQGGRAQRGNGEGAKSNEASATPVAAVAPTAPCAARPFNRANETLSDAGRWTNAIIGGEGGLNVSSNELACSVVTTCTAWRNNAQYGADTEV